MALKDLGDWETLDMMQRYAHLASPHLAHHAETVSFWSQQDSTNTNATPKSGVCA